MKDVFVVWTDPGYDQVLQAICLDEATAEEIAASIAEEAMSSYKRGYAASATFHARRGWEPPRWIPPSPTVVRRAPAYESLAEFEAETREFVYQPGAD